MTWSLIAKNPEDGAIAVIVASRFFACGAVVPFVGPTVAVASLSWRVVWIRCNREAASTSMAI